MVVCSSRLMPPGTLIHFALVSNSCALLIFDNLLFVNQCCLIVPKNHMDDGKLTPVEVMSHLNAFASRIVAILRLE